MHTTLVTLTEKDPDVYHQNTRVFHRDTPGSFVKIDPGLFTSIAPAFQGRKTIILHVYYAFMFL